MTDLVSMRQIIDTVQEGLGERLVETAGEKSIESAIKRAADDFASDWLDIRPHEEEREPEPRRSLIRKMREKGFNFDDRAEIHTTFPRVVDALIPLMREEAHRFLRSLPWKGRLLPVVRKISVLPGWERDPQQGSANYGGKGLGVYWAIDDKFEWTYARDGQQMYVIHSEVSSRQIDWFFVISKHLTYTENEIRIKDNAKVPILGITVEIDGQEKALDVSHLHGKLFSVGVRNADEWLD